MLDFPYCMLEVDGISTFDPHSYEFILRVFVDGALLVRYDRLLSSGFLRVPISCLMLTI